MTVLNLYTMNAFAAYFGHLGGDCVRAVASEPIHARAQQKVRSDVLGCAEQFIDVALSVADVHTFRGLCEQFSRLPKVLEPADAFLLLDRYTRRVDLLLECVCALEFIARPKLDRRQAKRQTLGRDRKT